MANLFDVFYISHASRFQYTKADALAALTATLALPIDITYHLKVATRRLVCPKHVLKTNEVHVTSISLKPRDWMFPLIDYALHDILPDDPKEAASIRRSSLRFYYNPMLKTLYRRSCDGILLRCFLTLKHKRYLRKNAMVYAELINQV